MTEITQPAREAEKASSKADLVFRQCNDCHSEVLTKRSREEDVTCEDH